MNLIIQQFLDQVETYVVDRIESIMVDKESDPNTYVFSDGLCFVHAMDNVTSVFLQPMNPLRPELNVGKTLPVPGSTVEQVGDEIIRLLGFEKT